jgi:uncharacterized RDD family membrane protein YckC
MRLDGARLDFRTAQGVRLSHPLAGPASRALAVMLDMAMMLAIVIAFMLLGSLSLGLASELLSHDLFRFLGNIFLVSLIIVSFLVFFGFPVYYEWKLGGQTPGKRVMGLRVVDVHGRRLGFNQIVLRNLLRMADMLPGFYACGGISMLLSPRAQRLGDLLADTTVVSVRAPAAQSLRERMTRDENSPRGHPRIEAMIRRAITPAHAAVLVQALNRRREMEDDARLALYRELAVGLREKAGITPETAADLPDEQLIRNVLDILHRTRKET